MIRNIYNNIKCNLLKKRYTHSLVNKLRFYFIVFVLFNLLLVSCKNNIMPLHIEMPMLHKNDTVIYHTYYSLKYSEQHEQAIWVAYRLTANQLEKKVERSNKFITDPKIFTESANDNDYYKSGYDRGHLAPSRDMSFDSIAQAESFYYSNMSPQTASFNRGIWSRLESSVRDWAAEFDTIYVITGPILKDGLANIGENKVSVPEHFYKAILVYTSNKQSAIGFVIPNNDIKSNDFYEYAVNIDRIEELTGLDLFPLLPNKLEKQIESTLNVKLFEIK
jgi:endonuclease G, mitochondrial